MFPIRDENKSESFPFVTISLIILNSFLYFYLRRNFDPEFLQQRLALIPYRITHFQNPKILLTLISYMFLHGSFLHLISNMLYLWIFGDNVEDRLGHLRFIYYYLLCGIGAGLIHIVMFPSSPIPTVGASGAISGILASYMLMFPGARIIALVPIFIFFEVVKIPALIFIMIWFFFQSIYGISSLSQATNFAGIAWFAHIGGFAIGAILLPIFLCGKRKYSS